MQAHDRKNPVYLQPFTQSMPASTAFILEQLRRGKTDDHPDATAQNWPSLTATFSEIWQSRTDYSPKTAIKAQFDKTKHRKNRKQNCAKTENKIPQKHKTRLDKH